MEQIKSRLAEAIACKLSGHMMCSMCGGCVDCTLAKNYESPGHMKSGSVRYRCNVTYLEISKSESYGQTREEIKTWWS